LDELHRALFLDRGFLVNSKTNYYDLGRRVQVLSFCLDDEKMIAAYGRKALEPLMTRLRLINGKIGRQLKTNRHSFSLNQGSNS